jgi:MinD-like ATPase involved in chromosome partitioning or flagellar assembly
VVKNNSAITAIRNIRQESFVAANLDLIGWTLTYRATDKEGLLAATRSHPSSLVIVGDDFNIEGLVFSNPAIVINSKEELGDNQLQDLLREVNESDTPQSLSLPPCSAEVTVVATVDSGLGGTTCAIEIAYEKSRLGKSTLLLDFNTNNPTLSDYFDVQRINRKVLPSSLGFSLAEVSELSNIHAITQESSAFDEVVIDLGRIPSSEHLVSGVRIHEVLARWSLQSASKFLLLSRSDYRSLQKLARVTSQLERTSSFIKPIALLVSHLTVTGRERREISQSAATFYSGEVRFLPRDPRLVERAAKERLPIALISPKSPLVQEFASLCKRDVKQGR